MSGRIRVLAGFLDDMERETGTPGVRRMHDALGREITGDWLRGCAQAREARLIMERKA